MRRSVLIVEDEEALLTAYSLLLETKEYQVFQATNGKEALATLRDKKPDYIVLDILMPIMGGIEFLKIARIPEKFTDTKVLVLSNLSDRKTLDAVMDLGASKYLLKANTSPRELIDALESL